MDNKIVHTLLKQINKDEGISPCLFLSENTQLLHSELEHLAQTILQEKNIPLSYLYKLEDNGEKIKITEIKNFLSPGLTLPGYPLQIFLIENISRLTLQAGNSCLKFFEEPGKHNIIFLSNQSESGILDTILSRVQIFQYHYKYQYSENPYFQSLIQKISQGDKTEALQYFYTTKIETTEYIDFLQNIILFAKKQLVFIERLSEIEEDILGIQNNNVNAKYIIDKYLLTL